MTENIFVKLFEHNNWANSRIIQVARPLRAGGTITAHPVNLRLAIATLASIVMIIGGIIVDQYPCWMGVPNCD